MTFIFFNSYNEVIDLTGFYILTRERIFMEPLVHGEIPHNIGFPNLLTQSQSEVKEQDSTIAKLSSSAIGSENTPVNKGLSKKISPGKIGFSKNNALSNFLLKRPPSPTSTQASEPSSKVPEKSDSVTQSHKKLGITNEEGAALTRYTTRSYMVMNAALRNEGNPNKLNVTQLTDLISEVSSLVEEQGSFVFPTGEELKEKNRLGAEIASKKLILSKQSVEFDRPIDDLKADMEAIDLTIKCLDKLPSYSEVDPAGNAMVSRVIHSQARDGTSLLDFYDGQIGNTLTEKAFFSTSSSLSGNCVMADRDTFIYITCPPGHSGKLIGGLSACDIEKEILFKPGSQFRVDSVTRKEAAAAGQETRNIIKMTAIVQQKS